MRPAPRILQGGTSLPRSVLWVMVGLSLCAGALGFLSGRSVADLSETEAIAVYAALYAQETGGDVTDCLAVPGTNDIWLIVRCASGDRARTYHVRRDGTLAERSSGPAA